MQDEEAEVDHTQNFAQDTTAASVSNTIADQIEIVSEESHQLKKSEIVERDSEEIQRLIREISKGSEYQRQEDKRAQQVKEKLDKYHAKIQRAQANVEYWQQTEVLKIYYSNQDVV